jgi:hypothetical protein
MYRLKVLIIALALCVALPFAPAALAQLGGPSTGVYPETGIYWHAKRSGEGLFLEVQGDMVAFGIFSYREDGSPVFYTGAGRIQSLPFEEQRLTGYYPAHIVTTTLFETQGGPVFGISGALGARETVAIPAGTVRFEFVNEREVKLDVQLTRGVPEGQPSVTRRFVSQFPYGIGVFGVNTITLQACQTDLRGEWVFVDMSDPQRTPWRFHFTELEIFPGESAITCPHVNPEGILILTYRDPTRGAEMRCVTTSSNPPAAPVPDPLDGRQKVACELRLAGSSDVVFWARHGDVGLKEITATLGPYPGTGHQRGTARVNGIRIR